MTVKVVENCRICGTGHFYRILDLGSQYLSGYFPKSIEDSHLLTVPLELVQCSNNNCGLLQLKHSVDPTISFHNGYGYRSGLNQSMIQHIRTVVNWGLSNLNGDSGSVLDIGSNDGTLINFVPKEFSRFAIDPLMNKFKEFYNKDVHTIHGFFPEDLFNSQHLDRKFHLISSLSMLYDVPDPKKFVQQIAKILDPKKGIWIFEQSYALSMLEKTAFDTICHEHLEYYSLKSLNFLLDEFDLQIIDCILTETNGGSILGAVAKKSSSHQISENYQTILMHESKFQPLVENFAKSVDATCESILNSLNHLKQSRKKIGAIGASTKGNTLLQTAQIDNTLIEMVGELNEEKYGLLTPGSWIPIVSEREKDFLNLDAFLVLPWHFKKYFRQQHPLWSKMVFPDDMFIRLP